MIETYGMDYRYYKCPCRHSAIHCTKMPIVIVTVDQNVWCRCKAKPPHHKSPLLSCFSVLWRRDRMYVTTIVHVWVHQLVNLGTIGWNLFRPTNNESNVQLHVALR